jgi:biopolymer transport protein ExbD
MTWKVRHEGSPQAAEGLTYEQVLQGLLDGEWEPTDEVQGPDDAGWVAFENHPRFAEVAEDLEPPPAKPYDDETRLDMTALIDVTLVLLIFFILTTTYAAMQKIIDAAQLTTEKVGPRTFTTAEVGETMVKVRVKKPEGGPAVVVVEGEEVSLDDLFGAFQKYAGAARKRKVLLDQVDDGVTHEELVVIEDTAKSAGMEEVLYRVE